VHGCFVLTCKREYGPSLVERLRVDSLSQGERSCFLQRGFTAKLYSEKIQPLLAHASASAIAEQIGVSRWYTGRIRQGYRVASEKALARLVRVSKDLQDQCGEQLTFFGETAAELSSTLVLMAKSPSYFWPSFAYFSVWRGSALGVHDYHNGNCKTADRVWCACRVGSSARSMLLTPIPPSEASCEISSVYTDAQWFAFKCHGFSASVGDPYTESTKKAISVEVWQRPS